MLRVKLKVIQYSKYDPMYGGLEERYWLYFWNDTLKQWGRPGDWLQEANKIYEVRER